MGIMSLTTRKDVRLIPKQDLEIERLKQEVQRLRQQNLKLTVENEFVKKLSALVDQLTKNRTPRK